MKSISKNSMALFTVVIGLTSVASASDSWDNCSNSDGTVQPSYGELTVNGERVAGNVRVAKTTVLKRTQETCTLKDSGQKVVSLDNTVSLEEIRYTYSNTRQSAFVICERGGSGIPAADSCK